MEPGFPSQHLQKRIQALLAADVPARGSSAEVGWGLGTTQGPRRDKNEDRCILMRVGYAGLPSEAFTLAVLCDGMGGMVGGDIAAGLAISTFVSDLIFSHQLPIDQRLINAVIASDAAVASVLRGRGGTTLSALILPKHGGAAAVNVGDSRIYGVSADAYVSQRSRDDTIEGLLAQGDEHQQPDNRLLQHVGMGRSIKPHLIDLGSNNTGFVITSDGAHGIGEKTFRSIVQNAARPSEIVRRLTYFNDISGGEDNATAIAIEPQRIGQGEQPEQGVTCEIWTPFQQLEVWLSVDLPKKSTHSKTKEPDEQPHALSAAERDSYASWKPVEDAPGRPANHSRPANKAKSRGGKSAPKATPRPPPAMLPLDVPGDGSDGFTSEVKIEVIDATSEDVSTIENEASKSRPEIKANSDREG